MSDELYTVEQAAEYLQVCTKTVHRLIKKKELLASKVGYRWRIKKDDISNYLNNNTNNKQGVSIDG